MSDAVKHLFEEAMKLTAVEQRELLQRLSDSQAVDDADLNTAELQASLDRAATDSAAGRSVKAMRDRDELCERPPGEAPTKEWRMFSEDFESPVLDYLKARARGQANTITILLETRGLPLTEEQRERVFSCMDRDVLMKWVRRAVTIEHTDQLFED